MPRREGRVSLNRKGRTRRKHFQGNQYSFEEDTAATSSAAKKLRSSDCDFIINQTHGYRFIEIFTVFSALSQMLICKECKTDVSLAETANRGLGFKIAITCSCGIRTINSAPMVNNAYEINRRMVFVMRLLGIGREGINIFCGLMDICKGLNISIFYAAIENIHTAASAVFHQLCRKAVEEEKQLISENEDSDTNFTVSGDGTWKKRGFSSLFGVATLIGINTGKIIDLVVKSSYCQSCTFWRNKKDTPEYFEWLETHEETCTINHSGSAGKMEVDSMQEMFLRSEEKFGVKYLNYVGDGDSKTFRALLDLQPYGEGVTLKKSECVGHVEKRMGTRLRNVKKVAKLGGKGKLTDALIKKLTIYYGLAIRRHSDSVSDMKKAIMATYYHMCSTQENPQHQYCPPGAESWCKWRVAEATETLHAFEHQPAFHKSVQDHLLPIYEDLSKDELLERCLGGYTQNCNESFNACIWRLAPKHLHCGSKTVEIATYLAAAIFNEGFLPILKIMETMGIIIGQQSKIFAEYHDDQRLLNAERHSLKNTKEARTARRMEKASIQDFFEEEEGLMYGAGIAE